MIHSGFQKFPVPVTPGSQTNNSGTGNFTVVAYNTLDIEVWGGGGGGNGSNGSAHIGTVNPGVTGGNSSVVIGGTTVLAHGGASTSNNNLQGITGVAPTASGGDTNTSGNQGGAGVSDNFPSAATSGLGAGAPNGGGDAAGVSSGLVLAIVHGNSGTAPGGGASGDAGYNATVPRSRGYCGACSGAYSKKTYHPSDAGAPAIGDSLAWVVGTGGLGDRLDGNAGDGANGRVKFTWS